MALPQVLVSRKGAARIERGHPWIFRVDVSAPPAVEPGALVRVVTQRGEPLGVALYSNRSEIALRLLTHAPTLPEGFVRERVGEALRWRGIVASGAGAYRLVHGEGDGLPALIVDRYGEYLVVQTLCQGMERLKDEIVRVLVELCRPQGILERNDPRVRQLEGLESRVSLLHGEVPEMVEVDEGGLHLAVDLWKGQKTGLFLDQRENHQAARGYARGRVLDAFSYQGGFALAAASVADEVVAIDVSGEALAHLRRNAERNGLNRLTLHEANVFDLLREMEARGERFDAVILDPPAFAKSRDAVPKAQRGYKEINLRAMKLLNPGGCLITCSCSYHIHEPDLEAILAAAALDAGATFTIVEKRSQARDHPVVLGVPETRYLKCFVLRKS
jgi:23S rRNA (cytosine1962-C5)-methyltransferase